MRTKAIAATTAPRESPSREMLGRPVRAAAVMPAFCVARTRLSTDSAALSPRRSGVVLLEQRLEVRSVPNRRERGIRRQVARQEALRDRLEPRDRGVG